MSDVKIDFSGFVAPARGVLVVFCDESLKLGPATRKALGRGRRDLVARAAAADHFKGKLGGHPRHRGAGRAAVGAAGRGRLRQALGALKIKDFARLGRHRGRKGAARCGCWQPFSRNCPTAPMKPEQTAEVALGAKLRAMRSTATRPKRRMMSRKATEIKFTIGVANVPAARKAWTGREGLADGVIIARDLVNEPPNILFPEEFARRATALRKLGVAVEVLDVKAMEKLGMGALLGVGQGSVHDSRLVVMRWNGGRRGDKPVAFVGKGVCFDTGGISIKPAAGMEDMKGDMAGAACVVGLMQALAARKAKVNAIGVIGLVENMPDGKAQRPGDIVKTMSGQTIEIINTDAEGRLVLADALHYVNTRFEPKFIVDLATLTGAIMVSLGQEYAGLFSNDDKLVGSADARRSDQRRTGLAHADGAGIRQDDRFEIRRHEEYRRPLRRLDHRGAVAAAFRRQDAVGASRHRRHRARFAADRHQQELERRLGRAAARPTGGRSLRGLSWRTQSGDPQRQVRWGYGQNG